MIHFSIFSIAIETVIGIANSMSNTASNLLLITAMLGFGKSLLEQLRVCFYLIKNENKKSAAMAAMIVPMMLIFTILLISSMGMSHFLTTFHTDDTIPRITNLAGSFLFKIESAIISSIFLIQIKKVIEISKMQPREIAIGFGVQIITAIISILMIILSILSFDVFQLEIIFNIPQIIIRAYIYGLYMVVVSIGATFIALSLYKTFGDKKAISYIEKIPWEIQDEKKINKYNLLAFKKNKKIAKNYIMGNNKHYTFGIFSLWALTFFLGYNFRFSDGQVGVGNFLMMASFIYIPYFIISLYSSKAKIKKSAYNTLLNSSNPKKYIALFVEEIVHSDHTDKLNISTKHFTYIKNNKNIQLIIKEQAYNNYHI